MLQLVLKKKWFDMIDSGEKLEEYRELKRYWWKRIMEMPYADQDLNILPEGGYAFKHKLVRFKCGYQKHAPEMVFKLGHVRIGRAKPEWAEGSMDKVIVLPFIKRLMVLHGQSHKLLPDDEYETLSEYLEWMRDNKKLEKSTVQ